MSRFQKMNECKQKVSKNGPDTDNFRREVNDKQKRFLF